MPDDESNVGTAKLFLLLTRDMSLVHEKLDIMVIMFFTDVYAIICYNGFITCLYVTIREP